MFCGAAGDLALLVDTNHPMIHPEFERGLEWAKKALQANGSFCLQVSCALLLQTLCVWSKNDPTFQHTAYNGQWRQYIRLVNIPCYLPPDGTRVAQPGHQAFKNAKRSLKTIIAVCIFTKGNREHALNNKEKFRKTVRELGATIVAKYCQLSATMVNAERDKLSRRWSS